ncbi:ABC transporter ATP-binding protein [Rhodococcus sp. ACS1]|uniref:ABC transporter ATP-binding protein n=1 Tax=Rhodococcus sp. ACS1 TaxID=2028570 RepID=UPI000BB11FEA|nr:ABC transporter ATP-binding protein [Rhodococcus sp. ACS1]PBC52040.1 ABC transporter ATP-binding protein [Rhodococcus sp. ACS1]
MPNASTTAAAPRVTPKVRPKIEFQRLGKRFHRKSEPVTVMEGLDLTIYEGEFVCVVGPSGCGKSTLLNMSAGLMHPSAGNVLYDGAPVAEPNTKVGYITQKDNLMPWRTVTANIALPLQIRGMDKKGMGNRVGEMIELVGLTGFEKAYPGELSGGMRKRVTLARTLAYKPEVIFADEPFGALDAQLRGVMQQELLRIWAASKNTVVFITHDISEAVALGDRVVVLSARPSRVKVEVPIDLPRPRDLSKLRFDPRFGELNEYLWSVLSEDLNEGDEV